MHARTDGASIARSICPYCGVGCGQLVYHKDGKLISIEGDAESPISQGNLCPKGAASYQLLTHDRRETKMKYRAPRAKEWTEISLDHAMAATLNDRIYVFGGYVFGVPTDRVFSLGANDARWIEHTPMPAPRAAGGAAVVGARAYIVGGVTLKGDWIRDTWAFDTGGRWRTDLPRIPTPRDHLAVGAYRGRVCAAGGNGANQVFECFDPTRNAWDWMPDLRRPVVGGRAVEAAGWFWVVAQDVHVFTIDHWHFGPRLNAVRTGHALVAVDDVLYVIETGLGAFARVEMLKPQP